MIIKVIRPDLTTIIAVILHFETKKCTDYDSHDAPVRSVEVQRSNITVKIGYSLVGRLCVNGENKVLGEQGAGQTVVGAAKTGRGDGKWPGASRYTLWFCCRWIYRTTASWVLTLAR